MLKLASPVRYREYGERREVTLMLPLKSDRPIEPVTRLCELVKNESRASRRGVNHIP